MRSIRTESELRRPRIIGSCIAPVASRVTFGCGCSGLKEARRFLLSTISIRCSVAQRREEADEFYAALAPSA